MTSIQKAYIVLCGDSHEVAVALWGAVTNPIFKSFVEAERYAQDWVEYPHAFTVNQKLDYTDCGDWVGVFEINLESPGV